MARRPNPQPTRPPGRPQGDWDFRSFPVVFAFACGALVTVFIFVVGGVVQAGSPVFSVVWIASLFGVSFGVAHIIGTWIRRRKQDKQTTLADEADRERRVLAARAAIAEGTETHTQRRRRRRR